MTFRVTSPSSARAPAPAGVRVQVQVRAPPLPAVPRVRAPRPATVEAPQAQPPTAPMLQVHRRMAPPAAANQGRLTRPSRRTQYRKLISRRLRTRRTSVTPLRLYLHPPL